MTVVSHLDVSYKSMEKGERTSGSKAYRKDAGGVRS